MKEQSTYKCCLLVLLPFMVILFLFAINASPVSAIDTDTDSSFTHDGSFDELTSDNFYNPFDEFEMVYILPDGKDLNGNELEDFLSLLEFTRTSNIDGISTLVFSVTPRILDELDLTLTKLLISLGFDNETVQEAAETIKDTGSYTIVYEIESIYVTTKKPIINTDSDTNTDSDINTDTDSPIIILPTFGDVNCDIKVTMEDVVALQKIIAKLTTHDYYGEFSLQNSDVNHDDGITMVDVTVIQKYIAKLIDSLDE